MTDTTPTETPDEPEQSEKDTPTEDQPAEEGSPTEDYLG